MDKSVIHADYSAYFENITSALLAAIVVRESDNSVKEEAEMLEAIIKKLGRAHSQLSRVMEALDAKTQEEKLEKIFHEFVLAMANMSPYQFKIATNKLVALVKESAKTRMSLR